MQDLEKESQRFSARDGREYLVWSGIKKRADCFGLQTYDVLEVALAFLKWELTNKKVSLPWVEACLERFLAEPDPMILAYEFNGERFLAVRKWQDYQRNQHPANANCPVPPPETLRNLSKLTRGLITETLQKFSSNIPLDVDVEEEKEVERPESGNPETGKLLPTCAFCRKPTNSLLQRIHDEYRKRFPDQPCLVIVPGRDNKRLKSLLDTGRTADRIALVYAVALRLDPPDAWLEREGYTIPAFVGAYSRAETASDKAGPAPKKLPRAKEVMGE